MLSSTFPQMFARLRKSSLACVFLLIFQFSAFLIPAAAADEAVSQTQQAVETTEPPAATEPAPINSVMPEPAAKPPANPDSVKLDIPLSAITPDLGKRSRMLAAAGLLLLPLDKSLVKALPRTESGNKSDRFTETVNMFGDRNLLLAGIGGMYLLGGRGQKDDAKLCLMALVNAGAITETLKTLTGRARPSSAVGAGDFHGPGKGNYASFPSGHTAAAFSVATVMANRHPKQKWLYYGLAAAVGYARVRKSAHFPSDVLVGAAVGTQSGRNALRFGPKLFSIKF